MMHGVRDERFVQGIVSMKAPFKGFHPLCWGTFTSFYNSLLHREVFLPSQHLDKMVWYHLLSQLHKDKDKDSQHRMAPSHLLPQMFPMLHLVSSEILCNWFFSNLNYQLYTQFAVFDSGASLSGFDLSLIFAIGGNIIARQANVANGNGKPTLARIKLQDSASTNPQCQPSSDQNRNGGFDLSNQEIQFCKERRKHESQPQKTPLLENLETWHQNKRVYQVIALHWHKQYKENIFQGMVWSQRCRSARRRQTFARILESKTRDVQQKGAEVTILSKKGKKLKSSL